MRNEQELWQIFAQTGDPVAYMRYKGVRVEEEQKEQNACNSTATSTVS